MSTTAENGTRPRRRRRPVLLVSALIACAAFIPASNASAADQYKRYIGEATHPPFFGLTDVEPYVSDVILTFKNDVLYGVYLEARTECPETAIRDVEVFKEPLKKSDRVKLRGGSFKFSKGGITIRGSVGKREASGTMSATASNCSVNDVSWTATKKRY